MSAFRTRMEDYIRREARPIDKFGHQPRLYALTIEIGKGQIYDDDIVFAATWLHDIGVFIGHRPEDPQALAAWDCTAYAMAQVPALLSDFDFPAAKRAAVVEAIRTHQPGAAPTTIERPILRDADILEQLGAVGIMRTVCKSAAIPASPISPLPRPSCKRRSTLSPPSFTFPPPAPSRNHG